MLKARQSEVRAIRRLPSEPESWLPQPSARQAAAATRESEDTKAPDLTLIGAPEGRTAEAGAGDFRNLADSIADMRRRRHADVGAETEANRPRSWLDEVRENVDRRRAAAVEERPATSESGSIARLEEMVEALQQRVERLEADNAALSARSARLEGHATLRLAPPPGTAAAAPPTRPKAAPAAGPAINAGGGAGTAQASGSSPSPAAGMRDIADALRALQSRRSNPAPASPDTTAREPRQLQR